MISRAVLPIAVVLTLAGCASAAPPAQKPTPTVTPISAEVTCHQYSEVLSLVVNSQDELRLGISTEDDLAAAIETAFTMVHEVESEPGTELAEDMAALQELSMSDFQTYIDHVKGTETPWTAALEELHADCAAAGAELTIEAKYGG